MVQHRNNLVDTEAKNVAQTASGEEIPATYFAVSKKRNGWEASAGQVADSMGQGQ